LSGWVSSGIIADNLDLLEAVYEPAREKLSHLVTDLPRKGEVIEAFLSYVEDLISQTARKMNLSSEILPRPDLALLRAGLEAALQDFQKPVTDSQGAFKDAKLVYDLKELNGLNGDVICSLKVNVEMQNLQLGFDTPDQGTREGEMNAGQIRLI